MPKLKRSVKASLAPKVLVVIHETDNVGNRTTCKCGNPAEPERPCPYEEDVHNNPESLCNCCNNCRKECAADI